MRQPFFDNSSLEPASIARADKRMANRARSACAPHSASRGGRRALVTHLSQAQLVAKKRVTNCVAENRLRDSMTELAAVQVGTMAIV
jgi:hypothetical protein